MALAIGCERSLVIREMDPEPELRCETPRLTVTPLEMSCVGAFPLEMAVSEDGRFAVNFATYERWTGLFPDDLGARTALFNARGELLWTHDGTSTLPHEVVFAPAFAPDGSLWTSGRFSGDLAFGNASVTAVGGVDIYVARYAADGEASLMRVGGDNTDIEGGLASAGDLMILGAHLGEERAAEVILQPTFMGLSRTGAVLWSERLVSNHPPWLYPLTRSGDGKVWAYLGGVRDMKVADLDLSFPEHHDTLLELDVDQRGIRRARLAATLAMHSTRVAYLPHPSGRISVAGGSNAREGTLGGVSLPTEGRWLLLGAMRNERELAWLKTLGSGADKVHAAAAQGEQVVVHMELGDSAVMGDLDLGPGTYVIAFDSTGAVAWHQPVPALTTVSLDTRGDDEVFLVGCLVQGQDAGAGLSLTLIHVETHCHPGRGR
ncbi:MAG: hypothetical protein AB2A00_08335 [Myxococcota bacterium]